MITSNSLYDADTYNPPLIVVSVLINTSLASKITLSEDDTCNPPEISTNVFTDNPPFSEIDAVNEPVAIKAWGGISSDNADNGMLNKFSPLPLNEPLNPIAVTLNYFSENIASKMIFAGLIYLSLYIFSKEDTPKCKEK